MSDRVPLQSGLRSSEEVVARIRALMLTAYKAFGDFPDDIPVAREQMADEVVFSPSELVFLDDPDPSDQARVQFSWGCEAALALGWALGLNEMPAPNDQGDAEPLLMMALAEDGAALQAGRLRSAADIEHVLSDVHDAHWKIRDAQINDKPAPDGLHPGVVMERHKALNWLTCYGGDEWDNVATDT
ncbi:MAG: DUF4272 domain-containing protein [Caulobacterales bacterium]|nr:DUF4272 domain-containing protein [Caulobacterales bacterium]